MDKVEDHMKKYEQERELQLTLSRQRTTKTIAYITSLAVAIIIVGLAFGPIYSVWAQRLSGEAELARAEANRQIRVLEAKAEQEAAKALAEAEVTRAEGVARANKIIGDSLQNNEGYLRYLWIQGLQNNHMQVVYVPTEANLPILEASRMSNKLKTQPESSKLSND